MSKTVVKGSAGNQLTSTIWIVPPKRKCPYPRSPPCTADIQSTRGDTCDLLPPENNKAIFSSVEGSAKL